MSKSAVRNAEYIKEYNRKLIMRLLRSRSMSRAEIARQTGLTRACTSQIASELIAEGFLIEEEPVTGQKCGRVPIPLRLSGDAGYAVGIFLNRSGCTLGLVDMTGKLIVEEKITVHNESERFEMLIAAVKRLFEKSGVDKERVLGIGISAPGPIDRERGRILNPPRFELWHETDIAPMLHEFLRLPVYLENDATCLASYYNGRPESQGSENFLLLLVDDGIGSGLITGGKIFNSAGHFAFELGHTSINYRGRVCACGNVGCLEEYASISSLLKGSRFRSWEELIDASDTDTDAQKLIRDEIEYFSTAIVNLTNLICIDTVLIAGELLYGFDRIAPEIEAIVAKRSLHGKRMPIRLYTAHDTPEINVSAAADIAINSALIV